MKKRNIFFTLLCLTGFTFSSYAIFYFKDDVLKGVSKSGAQSIARRMKAFYRKNEQFPSLEELRVGLNGEPETILQDAWGREFVLKKTGENVLIISAGLDGQMGTYDDLKFTVRPPYTGDKYYM